MSSLGLRWNFSVAACTAWPLLPHTHPALHQLLLCSPGIQLSVFLTVTSPFQFCAHTQKSGHWTAHAGRWVSKTGSVQGLGRSLGLSQAYLTSLIFFETFIGVLLGLWFYVYVVYAYGLCLVWTQGSLTTGTSLGCGIGNPVGFHWRYCKCWLTRKAEQQSRALLYIILETGGGMEETKTFSSWSGRLR